MRRSTEHPLHIPLTGLLALVAMALFPCGSQIVAQDLDAVGQRPAVTVGGSAGARLVAYGSNGITSRRSPFSWVLSGNIDVNLYDLSLPFSFTVSEQDRRLSQPFNQFGVSPHYKWITAHLGYRNLTFSPFTLAGHQILGAGVELNPGDFRLGFVTGRLARAVEEDTTVEGTTPAYERTGFSGRIGYGSEANHLDLIVVKAKDDPGSLRASPIDNDIRPAENLVLGASGRTTIIDGLSIYGDVAVSDFTRDVRSEELALSGETEALGDIIAPRTSTQIYTALTTGLAFNIGTFNLGASYTRIDPDYRSMGAYYLENDVERYSFTPSIALMENTLFVNGSLVLQHDNIQGKKLATTYRMAPMMVISYSPSSEFGITLQANDLITSQDAGLLPLNDTMRMEQRSPSVMVSPHYLIGDTLLAHGINGTLSYQTLVDDNRFTSQYTEYTSIGADVGYTLSMAHAGLMLGASLSHHRLSNLGGTYTSNGLALNGSKTLDENRVTLDGSFGVSLASGTTTINAGIGGGYRPTESHAVNLELSLTTSRSSDVVSRSFLEYITVLSYAYSF